MSDQELEQELDQEDDDDAGPARELEPLFVDVPTACDLLMIKRNLMYELINAGTIPSVKLGRLRRIPYHWLKAYAEQVAQQDGTNGHLGM